MPLCQICKQREAAVYFTRILNGFKTKMYVCRQCAGQEGLKIDLNSLLTGLLAIQNAEIEEGRELSCDRCGMTIDEFNNTGRMGCSKCYEVFFEPMQVLLNRIQGNTHHCGKNPNKAGSRQTNELQIVQLKQELADCIRNEAYERAAEIRDKIKALQMEKGCSL
ncbi:MAG: DNA helicase UvrBC [Clostridiaceae bacterium]|jgi:protein arginine kinase activator|nr:DNA helicase UvrBC [Clostridiaceae bacterium]